MALPETFKIKALTELREDELRKSQSLQHFREWIAKQSHIKNCRTGLFDVLEPEHFWWDVVKLYVSISDENFLLRFLRVKKYSNADAVKMLEKLLVSCETHPEWFRHLTLDDDDRMRELFESGFIFPLKDRDENGCRVIMLQARKLDTKRFTFTDVLKAINFVIFTLLEEPETQIAGFVYVIDHKDISMDYVGIFSLTEMRDYLKCIQNAIPCRQKQAYFVHLPGFAVKLTDFAKGFVSSKLKERAFFYKDFDKLFGHLDPKILPKEFGGTIPVKEMMDHFIQIARGFDKNLRRSDEQSIDLSFIKSNDIETIGSFKRLEIDWLFK